MDIRQQPQSEQVNLRMATAADAPAISALLRESFAEFRSHYTPAAFAATVLPASGVLARLNEGPVWVAEREATIEGTVGAILSGESATIRGMAVRPSVRHLGLGRRLLDEAERFAAEHGAQTLELYTTAFLLGAIRLYEAAGFTFTGQGVNPNGTELLRMTKRVHF
jgi:ribosomal protein S18 acetylase RimI-like enzyme